jgi:hypothetical protein
VTAGTIPVPIAIANGGTGAVTAPAALVALGAAPIASPAFTGNPTAPTQAVGDADTSLATTAFVQAAARYLNYADDSGFSVNQRGYVSGTALAAGIYGHDRWKAGAGGCTYTFSASSGPSTTITITAGTLQQIIEGASLVGGNYMLSWIGTAQGRVGGGSYAASPVAVSGIVAGANTTVEFNAGTLSQVKFEVGTVATAWAANSARYDLANCQRFYQTGTFGLQGFAASTAMTVAYTQPLQVAMRALPTCVVVSESSTTNMAARGIVADSAMQIRPYGAAANVFSWLGTFTASADL